MSDELAKIEKAEVGMVYDGRFLGLSIIVNYEDGGHQDILGGICLHNPHQKAQSSYAARILCEVLEALKIEKFKDAKDKFIMVIGEGSGLSFRPKGFKSMSSYGDQKTVMFDVKDEENDNQGKVNE